MHVSPTANRDLLHRTLAGPGAAERLRALDRRGRLEALIPEVAGMKGVTQPKEHYWDVFEHSVETVAGIELVLGLASEQAGAGPLLVSPSGFNLAAHLAEIAEDGWDRLVLLKLAALIHDIAKPATKSIQENGRMRFFHHATEGAEMADRLMARLGFGPVVTSLVATLVRFHLRPGQLGGEPYPTPRALFRFFRDAGDATADLLILNLADHWAMRGPLMDPRDWEQHLRLNEYILAEYVRGLEPAEASKLVNGYDLMDDLGLAAGPQLGELLRAVYAAQEAGAISTREEAIELAASLLRESEDERE